MNNYNQRRNFNPPRPLGGEGRGEGEYTPHPMSAEGLARMRASEGHVLPDPDDGQHPLETGVAQYDKATVGWALACLAVLVGIVICAIAQSPGGGQ